MKKVVFFSLLIGTLNILAMESEDSLSIGEVAKTTINIDNLNEKEKKEICVFIKEYQKTRR